jgi:hypothetical protein
VRDDQRAIYAAADARGELPDKVPGKHRYIVMVTYTITQHQASAMFAGSRVVLGEEQMLPPPLVGCLDCEEPYDKAKGNPCAAEGFDWHGGG